MFCTKCGAPLREDALFCNRCGAKVNRCPAKKTFVDGTFYEKFVPTCLKKKFPHFSARTFLIGYIVVLLMLLICVSALAKAASHDLSGTYRYDGRFPIGQITFYKDGTFSARTTYYEYDTGDVYYGKYKKSFGKYSLRFTSGKGGSKNAISNYRAENIKDKFSMRAEKNKDGSLSVTIVSGTDYYAWNGRTATFR